MPRLSGGPDLPLLGHQARAALPKKPGLPGLGICIHPLSRSFGRDPLSAEHLELCTHRPMGTEVSDLIRNVHSLGLASLALAPFPWDM
jgi:hypothetical protein